VKIYVSATYKDLRACRKVVCTTLRQLRQDDVAMEYYVAEPERPLDVCLRDVRDCDLYLGIFAWRYGHVPDGDDQSITESEYRQAVAAGKPCLIFLLHEDAPWPRSLIDRAPDRIEALRAELQERHTVTFFSTDEELGRVVSTAVSHQLLAVNDPAQHLPQLDVAALNRYFERLRAEYGRLDLHGLTPPVDDDDPWIRLESVFVEQDVREDRPPVDVPEHLVQRLHAQEQIDEDELPEGFDLADLRAAQEAYRAKPRRPVLGVVAGADRCLVVLGKPGAGKSTLARYLALTLAGVGETLPHLTGHLPLLVELKLYLAARERSDCRTVIEFLQQLANSAGLCLEKAQLLPYLDAGGAALIVFDGLDEVFDPGQRDAVTREIAEFASRYPGARVVVTSRIHGYKFGALTGAGFRHFTLQDLDAEQIERFLTAWYTLVLRDRPAEAANRKARLLGAVRASASIEELAGNPLLLTILAIIGKHQKLPRDRWRVYDHAASVLVRHWDTVRNLKVHRVIDEDDKRELLRRLAWSMQNAEAGAAGNYVHRTNLQASFEAYLVGPRYEMSRKEAATTAREMIAQFQERDFILSRYGPDLYGFVHRGFLEYFCAEEVLKRFKHDQNLTLDGLKALFVGHCHDPAWTEVLRLIASQISAQHVGVVIEALLEVDRPWPVHSFQRPPRGIALAAQCLAEVGNPRALADTAERVITEVVLLLEHCIGIEDRVATAMIDADVLPAARAIGRSWPGRAAYERWYRRRGIHLIWAPITTFAAQFLAMLFPDRPDTVLNVADLAADHRSVAAQKAAARELAAADTPAPPRDPAQEASEDRVPIDVGAVRARAAELLRSERVGLRAFGLAVLERVASDASDLEPLLRDRLIHDDDDDVFRAAALTLLRCHPDDPTTLDIITIRTENDPDSALGRVGLGLLTNHRPNDPRTHALATRSAILTTLDKGPLLTTPTEIAATVKALCDHNLDQVRTTLTDLAAHDVGYRVRHNALVLLDHLAPDDPDLEPLLRDRLTHDDDDDVFHAAAQTLLRRHPDDPTTLDTITTRTEHDPDSALGQVGLGLLARHRPTDPRVHALTTLTEGGGALLTDPTKITATVEALRDSDPDQVRITLTDFATRDDADYWMRHNALVLLDHLAPVDPDLEPLLRTLLTHDDDEDVFHAAARALLRRHPDDPTTLDTITTRTEHEPESALGQIGLDLLTHHRLTDPSTQALVTDVATHSPAAIRARVAEARIMLDELPELRRSPYT
jgi:hypothetical protein